MTSLNIISPIQKDIAIEQNDIEKYRSILKDYKTSNEEIIKKIEYLKDISRVIIKLELNKIYATK